MIKENTVLENHFDAASDNTSSFRQSCRTSVSYFTFTEDACYRRMEIYETQYTQRDEMSSM